MKKLILLLLALFLLVPVICLTSCDDEKSGEECTHTWADATCTTPKTCTKCHKTEGEALGHDYGEFVTVKPATCVEGRKEKTCSRCCDVVSESIPANGKHDYSEAWSYDANHHYHVCQNEGCNQHELEIPHVDNDADGLCDTCGYGEKYKSVTLKFTVGGVLTEVKTVLVKPGTAMTAEQVAEIKTVLYQGYGFAAWYSDAECENAFDFTAVINADTVIYASRGDLAGTALTYAYDATTKTLTFSGSGDMYDYQNFQAVPWNGLDIENVVFCDGLTSVGAYAFYGMKFASVSLPAGLKKIGNYAFYGQSKLTKIDFPESLETIGDHAFRACTGLTYIDIGGKNLDKVGESAFAECSAATYVVYGDAIDGSTNVFESCKFTHAYFAGNKAQFESVDIAFGNLQLEVAYQFFYASYEPQKAGPYWYRGEDGTPKQWCYAIYYLPSDGLKTAIEKDYVFVKNPKITTDNIEFRNNIWYNGYQFESWNGNPTFSEGVSLTGDVKYTGGRGNKVGDGVDYSISGSKLIISGSGKMWDFGTVKAAPWNEVNGFKSETITEIVIGSNVTYIGDFAFCNFPNLESIEIKNNIVEMSTKAFSGCTNLKYVYYYGNELEALNCKGLKYQENANNLVVYYQELEADGICDTCGSCISNCVDENGDKICDVCGKCTEGHTDENKDGKCDACKTCVGEHVFEKSATKCDVCGTCKTHVDADISFLTSKGIVPAISYWKDVEVGTNDKGEPIFARITWEFADGVLTIGGEGAIPDFAALTETPWANTFVNICKEASLNFESIDKAVTKIVIRDGITAIGNNAFNGLKAAAEVVLTETNLGRISSSAFTETAFITNATYDDAGLFIVNNSLIKADPTKVENVVLLPTSLVCIADGAFTGCTNVTGIRIPKGLQGATENSYSGLDSLKNIFFHGTESNWNANATKSVVPATATVYFFSNRTPTKRGYYWKTLNNPTIYEDWLPESTDSSEEN